MRVFVQYQGEVYAGEMKAWRKAEGLTTGTSFSSGLVQFTRMGRQYELWFPQGAIRPVNQKDDSVPDEEWTTAAVERFIASLRDCG